MATTRPGSTLRRSAPSAVRPSGSAARPQSTHLSLDVPVGTVFDPRPQRVGQDDDDPDAARLRHADGRNHRGARPVGADNAAWPFRGRRTGRGTAFHLYLSGRDNLLRLDAADRTVTASRARARVGDALDWVGLAAAAASATARTRWECDSGWSGRSIAEALRGVARAGRAHQRAWIRKARGSAVDHPRCGCRWHNGVRVLASASRSRAGVHTSES